MYYVYFEHPRRPDLWGLLPHSTEAAARDCYACCISLGYVVDLFGW